MIHYRPFKHVLLHTLSCHACTHEFQTMSLCTIHASREVFLWQLEPRGICIYISVLLITQYIEMVGNSHLVSLRDGLFIMTIQSKNHLHMIGEWNNHIAYSYPCTWSEFSRQIIHSYRKHVSLIPFEFCHSLLATHMVAICCEFQKPNLQAWDQFWVQK